MIIFWATLLPEMGMTDGWWEDVGHKFMMGAYFGVQALENFGVRIWGEDDVSVPIILGLYPYRPKSAYRVLNMVQAYGEYGYPRSVSLQTEILHEFLTDGWWEDVGHKFMMGAYFGVQALENFGVRIWGEDDVSVPRRSERIGSQKSLSSVCILTDRNPLTGF